MSLIEAFDSLPRPSSEGSFAVEATSNRFRVAKSIEGFPAILIAFDQAAFDSLPRRLANIGYSPPKELELTGSAGTHSERLAVLECRTLEPGLVEYFFRVVSGILIDDPSAATPAGFEAALDAVVSLFRALQQPAQRTVQGLWAELAIIAWAREPEVAISAWHSGPRALHDFAAGDERLEVKGSATGIREHSFRLDQLRVIDGARTLVASLLLDEATSGANVFDLIGQIEARIPGPELRRRLQAVVATSLGAAWKEAGDLRFDEHLARQRLRLYRAEEVPSILLPVRPEVKDVSFTSDLSNAPPLPVSSARSMGPFFDSLLPTT